MADEVSGTRAETTPTNAAPGTNPGRPGKPDLALTETQNWSSRSHQELYDAVHVQNEPGRVGEMALEWALLGDEIGQSAQRMGERLRATEAGWQGEAATAARGAIQQLADWSSTAGETASTMGGQVADQGLVMEAAKRNMPEPVKQPDFGPALAIAFASRDLESFTRASNDIKASHDQANTAHEQAVSVVQQMETDSRVIDRQTPTFAPPPNPIRDEATPAMQATPRHEGQKLAPMSAGGGGAPAGQAPGPDGAQQDKNAGPLPQPGGSPGTPANTVSAMHGGGPGPQPGGGPGPQTPTLGDSQQGSGPGTHTSGHVQQGPSGSPKRSTGGSRQFDGPTAKIPHLKSDSPSDTKSQGAKDVTPPTSRTGGGEDGHRNPRPTQTPDGTGMGGGPLSGNQPGGKKPESSRTGWNGAIPPIPGGSGGGAGGGAGGGGMGGSGGSGGLGSSGGSGGAAPPPAPGGRSGAGAIPGPAETGAAAKGSAGAGAGAGAAGGGAMGGAPGGAGARGRGGEEEQRSMKYVEGEQIFEVPGDDLPPPVIGAGKTKKKKEEE